ncbi:MAG TPA: hypothetical protein VI318_20040 [Baekduia sp.]
MKAGGWVVLAGWGALLIVIALAQLAFSWKTIELVLLAGSGGVVVLAGAATAVAERRRGARGRGATEVLRWTSLPTVAVAAGVCLIVLGWEVGVWCLGIGLGVTALGLFGVIRETRTGRP